MMGIFTLSKYSSFSLSLGPLSFYSHHTLMVPADTRRGVGQVVLEYDERDDVKEAEYADRRGDL